MVNQTIKGPFFPSDAEATNARPASVACGTHVDCAAAPPLIDMNECDEALRSVARSGGVSRVFLCVWVPTTTIPTYLPICLFADCYF